MVQTWTRWPTTTQKSAGLSRMMQVHPSDALSQVTAGSLSPAWPSSCNVVASYLAIPLVGDESAAVPPRATGAPAAGAAAGRHPAGDFPGVRHLGPDHQECRPRAGGDAAAQPLPPAGPAVQRQSPALVP